jgi:putative CocE/NonD family hydrolase
MSEDQTIAIALDVPARMRDGVVLRANVYRPGGDGPWPTLLLRTPYGKDDPVSSATLDPVRVARQGYMVVVQDVRGCFASEGEWAPLAHEREDGFDTVEWAARLPGSSGRVGMYGGSYCGSTQWLAALEQPPSLAAIAPLVTWCEPLDGLLARGGVLELGIGVPWALNQALAQLERPGLSDDERERRRAELIDDLDRVRATGFDGTPDGAAELLGRHGARDLGAVDVRADPSVAARMRVSGRHQAVAVPALNLGGWYDCFLQGTIDNHLAMVDAGRPTRLLIGPWAHGDPRLADPIGELVMGMSACGLGIPTQDEGDLNDLQLAFLRWHLTDGDGTEPGSPVRIFTLGRNSWRDEPSWPLARARSERQFLCADGALAPSPPSDGPGSSAFDSDPADPVPTVGGNTIEIAGSPPGPFDQARVEAREDVLVFTSEPLQAELEVTGRVRVVLHASSSSPSADWVARLCDVHPDGRSFNVCDGIVRVAGDEERPQRVEIDLWSTSIAFLPGHRLRVHVTGSSFPRWERNLHTGDQSSTRSEVARQTVYHGPHRASWIELPVVR